MTAPLDLLRPALAGRYDIDDDIAGEISGDPRRTTYHARDLRRGESCELSIVAPSVDIASTRAALARLTRVRHPWLALPTEVGEDAGVLWFATPASPGELLRDRLARDGRLDIDDTVRIARDAAQALQFAHDEKLVHGALSSGSILLSPGGGCVIVGAGLQRAFGEGNGSTLDDQAALAAVAFEMLTGSIPAADSSGAPPSARALRPEVPAALDAALQRALSPERSRRFACMADLELAIRPPVEAMPRRWSLATKVIGALILAIVLVVSAVGLWMVARVAAEGDRPVAEPMATPR